MSLLTKNRLEKWQASDVTPTHKLEVCPNPIAPIGAPFAATPNATAPIVLPSRDREGAPATWITDNLGFTPDNLQAEVLNATENSVLLLCTRQWGKSTIAAAKALHHALTVENAFIIAASACKRQSSELARKYREFAAMIGLRTKRDGEGYTLPNGARIVAVPQNPEKVRCYSAPTLVIIDEAAFVSDEMYQAVTPMLATSNGTIWLMSTAGAQRGFFYKTWLNRPEGWKFVTATADDCPRISVQFLARERASMGATIFSREYLCEFVAGQQQLVSQEDANAIFDTDF